MPTNSRLSGVCVVGDVPRQGCAGQVGTPYGYPLGTMQAPMTPASKPTATSRQAPTSGLRAPPLATLGCSVTTLSADKVTVAVPSVVTGRIRDAN